MATLQQIKEAARLKREGTPLDKAVSTVRATTANPPVTPPTPTATPPQTMQGVNGETFTVAPVNPETGLSQPAPITTDTTKPIIPVQEIAKSPTEQQINQAREVAKSVTPTTPVKTEAPIDYNTSAGRESEIQKNVSELTKTNPNLLKDRNAYNQAFGYETADPGKKAILDASFNGGQPAPVTASSLYSLIANKQEIPLEQKNSGAYRVANNRYQRVNQYVNMTPTEVNQAFTSGKLIEGSQTFEDLKSLNPKLVQDAVNLRKVNGNKTSIFTYTNNPDGTPVKTNNLEKNFAEQYEEDYPDIIAQLKSVYQTPTYDEMISKINTQEVKDIQAKASAIETEMNDLQTAMDNIDKDVETELKGSGATSSRIALEKSARKSELQKQYDAKLRDYTTQYNKANNLINQNTEIYKYTQEQNKAMQSALAGVYTKQYESKLDMENSLALSQMQYDQQIAQQAQAMGTPELAIPSVIDEYAKLGVMAQKSAQQHIADAKAFIAQGGTLGEYISQMQKDFQAKPEYKAKFAPKTTEPWTKLDDKTLYNQTTGETKEVTTSSYLNVPRTGNNVGQDTNNPGNIMGDTEAQRNIALGYGAVGFYKSPNGRTYAVFPDMESGVKASMADLQAKLSGGSSWATQNTTLEKFASGWVSGPNAPINQNAVSNYVKLTGYPKNTPISQIPMDVLAKAVFANEGVDISKSANLSGILSQGTGTTGTTGTQYNDQNIADLAYLVELQEKNPTQASKDMKELGYTARDIANYKAGNVPLTDRQKQTSVSLIDDIKDLVTNYDWNDATGVHFGMPVIAGTDRADTLQKIDQLVAKMTLPNLGSLKGPMSDKDLAFITKASSNLSAELSDAQFEKNLVQAYNVAARRAGIPEITKLSDIGKTTQSTQNTGAGQISQQDLDALQKILNP